jgi:hypothetical protein
MNRDTPGNKGPMIGEGGAVRKGEVARDAGVGAGGRQVVSVVTRGW